MISLTDWINKVREAGRGTAKVSYLFNIREMRMKGWVGGLYSAFTCTHGFVHYEAKGFTVRISRFYSQKPSAEHV